MSRSEPIDIDAVNDALAVGDLRIVNGRIEAVRRRGVPSIDELWERMRRGMHEPLGDDVPRPISPKWTPHARNEDLAKRLGLILDEEIEAFRANAIAKGDTRARWDTSFSWWLYARAKERDERKVQQCFF